MLWFLARRRNCIIHASSNTRRLSRLFEPQVGLNHRSIALCTPPCALPCDCHRDGARETNNSEEDAVAVESNSFFCFAEHKVHGAVRTSSWMATSRGTPVTA